jgi:dolichyl-phosphate beta-glucosyltransferase
MSPAGDRQPYRLAVIIPARNESLRLPATLRDIAATRLPDVELVELVVALNGELDQDDTAGCARTLGLELGLPLRVLHCAEPGKAGAVRTAMLELAARDDLHGALFMDADNATPLGALKEFALARDGLTIEIASIRAPGARVIAPPTRRPWRPLLSRAGALWAKLWLGLPERDTQRGFKLFPCATIAPLFRPLASRSWVFDMELLARAHRLGLTVREVPVTWTEMPGSKVSPLRDALGSAIDVVRIWRRLRAEERIGGPLTTPAGPRQ